MELRLLLLVSSDSLPWYYYMLTFLTLSWLSWKVLTTNRRRKTPPTAAAPPGNLGFPVIGETIQFMAAAANTQKGFYHFVHLRRLKYGVCFKTRIFGETHVFVSSAEAAKAVLGNEKGRFTKRYIKSIAELVGDQSLLCASIRQHKLLRPSFTHLFSTNSVSSMVPLFDELILKAVGTWHHQATVIVLHQALQITFKAICKMVLSMEDEEELQALQRDVGLVYGAMLAFPLRLPWTRFYNGLQARKGVTRKLGKIIKERRMGPRGKYDDFLQHLLLVKKDNENGDDDDDDENNLLTDEQITDNILTMIIAGQDTTASAIAWMIKYLDENEEALNQLKIEQWLVQEKISMKTFLTLEDLNHMPYALKVVKESLRMASIVPWFPRVALQDCEIEGYEIKKGWNVNVDAKSIHFDPHVYDDPNKFIPSRFDDDAKPYSFLAFGTGGRTCIGLNMAKAMMLVFLHRLVTIYEWEVIDKDWSVEKWTLFSRLKSGCPIHVTRINKSFTSSTP
ncbi:PREDICTED: abscisic acid 8'-hydroxylase 4 [Ipomoea nil]|uniref:abscisic acid 8'-hydroxylase 4 n=1 Tax=Ipomoea nil TaxID=35883 RepID=UPI000900D7E8|nr:PREDICTED: abscisic acid 8'-hydroxylase 4 [Ipomoea nil]